ncbi:hypothetical protein ZYGM_000788 [Zygosaccharomyces mellis]|uniref:Uncharacterized protein n=1 Tax=Zygosaccharomyces mellis TaxID=42258 RepID=A0A4C2EHC0_9SACH|nr:hypothetical protein ZYGM_000788 [Zygosaccharomyces mellis]
MNRYQALLPQTNSYRANTSNFPDLIQAVFLFALDLGLTAIGRLLGTRDSNNNSSILDGFKATELQPILAVSRVRSLSFDMNQKSFENHEYHPWLVAVVGLLAVGMLSYDLSKSSKSEGKSGPVKKEEQLLQETAAGKVAGEVTVELELAEDDSSDECVFKEKPPIILEMPKTFRTQRKEIGLPYQDLTVSRSTPISLILWESK